MWGSEGVRESVNICSSVFACIFFETHFKFTHIIYDFLQAFYTDSI